MANVTVVVSKIQEGKKNCDIVAAIRDHFTDPQVLSASDERYGKAFVNFATLEAATRAVELLNGQQLFGNVVIAKLQGGGATTAPVARPPQPPIATISGNPPIAVAAAIVAAPAARAPLVPGNQTVIISPIPLGSSQEAILDDVRAYGCQCTSASSVLPNGKVYINFESAESALDAVRLLMGKMVLGTTVTVTLKDPSSVRSSQTKVHAPVPLPAIIVPDKAAPPDVFRFAMAQLHKAEKFHDKKLSIARSRLCREKGAPPSFNGSANQTHEQMTNVFKIAVCELVGQQMFSKVVKKRIIDQFAVSSKQPSDVKETKFRLIREAYRLNEALPALALRSVIEDKIMEGQFLVIQGATGSGYVLYNLLVSCYFLLYWTLLVNYLNFIFTCFIVFFCFLIQEIYTSATVFGRPVGAKNTQNYMHPATKSGSYFSSIPGCIRVGWWTERRCEFIRWFFRWLPCWSIQEKFQTYSCRVCH